MGLITEEDPAVPISYYGLSKWTAENYIRIYSALRGIPFTILRYGNVYGPRQKPKGEGGVIAVFIQNIKNGLPVYIHGDGKQTRDFIFVKDVVQANMSAIKFGSKETYNVSTGRTTMILDIVHMLEQIHGSDIGTHYSPAREGDVRHSCLDNSKAFNELKWEPQVAMIDGLIETYHSI